MGLAPRRTLIRPATLPPNDRLGPLPLENDDSAALAGHYTWPAANGVTTATGLDLLRTANLTTPDCKQERGDGTQNYRNTYHSYRYRRFLAHVSRPEMAATADFAKTIEPEPFQWRFVGVN